MAVASETTPLFLDTAYVHALVNTRDEWHAAALAWERRLSAERRRLLTTELVLAEIADGLAAVRFRTQAVQVVETLQSSPFVQIVPMSSTLFAAAFGLYRQRADKDWGLTDCASFVVMREHGVFAALTTDVHFQQAHFQVPLRE